MAAAILLAGPLAAQEERRLEAPADLHRDPDGTPLVSLPEGAAVEAGKAEGDWRKVTVEGWVYSPSTSPTRREGFDLVVTSDKGENLRRKPNGTVVGRIREGTLLERVGEKGKWFQVRRDGWVPQEAVPAKSSTARRAATAKRKAAPSTDSASADSASAASADQAPAQTPASRGQTSGSRGRDAVPAPPSAPLEGVETVRDAGLSRMPDSAAAMTLPSGTAARVIGRSGDWVRVQVEGWLREGDVKPAESGVMAGISAAEIRSSPDKFVGQTLDWRLQVIAVQTADELRPEMPPGQPYLLTRGPLPEPGFVYVTIPPERVAEFRALPPLHEAVMRVTLKAARTRYLSTPVAELVSLPSAAGGR